MKPNLRTLATTFGIATTSSGDTGRFSVIDAGAASGAGDIAISYVLEPLKDVESKDVEGWLKVTWSRRDVMPRASFTGHGASAPRRPFLTRAPRYRPPKVI